MPFDIRVLDEVLPSSGVGSVVLVRHEEAHGVSAANQRRAEDADALAQGLEGHVLPWTRTCVLAPKLDQQRK
jgi:hypothetical protein